MMNAKRQEKLDRLIEKRDALRNKDFDKLDKIAAEKPVKEMSMNHVYIDVALAIFFMLTLIGAPIGLFFAATAIFKYSVIRKQRKDAQRKEPRA
jgi:hypothetical protein